MVPHQVVLPILNKMKLLIWMFNMKIQLKIFKMQDLVLKMEIKEKNANHVAL